MRAAAMAASHPAWPAPTTTTSKFSVKGGISSVQFYSSCFADFAGLAKGIKDKGHEGSQRESGGDWLELRPSDVGEGGFLPLLGREIPVAGAGFVVVSSQAVGSGRSAPIVHPHLQQGSRRNLDASFDGAAFEVARWQRSSGRCTPEMPDAI